MFDITCMQLNPIYPLRWPKSQFSKEYIGYMYAYLPHYLLLIITTYHYCSLLSTVFDKPAVFHSLEHIEVGDIENTEVLNSITLNRKKYHF